ncbi:MAG: sensor histidine kinase [Oscillospiraceae bacterium]|nr:sensor histidine kinase [Oscillospiraceae bacterium]
MRARFAFGSDGSLRSRIRGSQIALVLLMLAPAVAAIAMMLAFSAQYHAVISQIEGVSSLQPMISERLLTGVLDIVVGRGRFEDGAQYETLLAVEEKLDTLINNNAASRSDLEVARRVLGTLRRYVDELGLSMRGGASVDDTFKVNDEIKNVAALFVEMLDASIKTEIASAAVASNHTQTMVLAMFGLDVFLLIAALAFAATAQRSLLRAIQTPLDRLEQFAGRIAQGELSGREPPPDAQELQALTHSLNTMAFRLQRLIEQNKREQDNLMKSELRTLQAQITPHFLYNTLDAIVWLAESKNAEQVINVTRALSSFFRTSLAGGREWITIAQELEHLTGYLTIQKVRYRDILAFKLDVDDGLQTEQILKLLIQPLVENAIYHGIKNKRGGGMIVIKLESREERLYVTVADAGAGMTAERVANVRAMLEQSAPAGSDSGFGLYNVDRRIKLYYGQDEGVRIVSSPGEGTRVCFDVPLKRSDGV